MKRLALSMTILGVAWWLWTVRTIQASNDRYIVAQFTNGTSQEPGGANATLDLTVFNDIRNLSYPNHFIQWIQVTVPVGLTGSGPGGAFTSADFIPPSGWSVSSIAGNVSTGYVITFISASTDYTFNAGQSRTFLLKVHTPTATACPGTTYTFHVLGNQSTNGGNGNTYKYRPTAPLPTVAVTNCVTPTFVVLNSVQPGSIFTTGNSQTVALKATLTTLAGHDLVGNPIPGVAIANEPLTFNEGSAAITTCQEGVAPPTNSLGVATCTYTPLTGPVTPLVAGNYDESASFAGDSAPYPPYGASNSSTKQLTVSATATSLTVPDASGPYGGSVTLTATLASGAGQTGVSGQTITFSLNGSSVGSASTNNSGVATLNNVSIAGIAGGTYPAYIKASFAGNGTYDAITNYAQLVVTPVDQTITFTGPGDQAFVNGSVGISATDSASLLLTFTSNTTNVCTVGTGTLSGSITSATVSFVSLGQCSITASQNGNSSYGAATPVTQTFNIGNASMTCTLGNMSVIYTGLSQSPTCSTNVSGTSCKADNAPQISAGYYPENAVSQTAGYTCSSVGPTSTGTFIINKVPQVITLNAASPLTYNQSETLSTSGSSGTGAVHYTLNSGSCTLNATTLTATSGTGSCSVTATIDADTNYSSASDTKSVTLGLASQTITLNAASPLTYNQSETLSTSGSSGTGTISYTLNSGSCTLTGTTLKATGGTGSCSVTATIAADGNYSSVSDTKSVTLALAGQTITLNATSPLIYNQSETLSTSGSSGTGTISYTLNSGSCTLDGTTLKATSGTGSCSVTATIAADNNYAAASSADVQVQLNKALAQVNASNLTQAYTGNSLQPTVDTVPAALSLTYTGTDSLPKINVGDYNVGWTINDTNYWGSYNGTFHITGADQSITFRSFIVAATATSGGAVTFSSGDVTICTVVATDPPTNQAGQYTALVTLVGSNTDWTKCKVLADQTGTTNYNAAPEGTAILGNPANQ